MVEVAVQDVTINKNRLNIDQPKDNEDASSLFAESVLCWHLHVVECDVSGARRRGVTCLYLLCLHTRSPFNENNCETILVDDLATKCTKFRMHTSVLQPTVK